MRVQLPKNSENRPKRGFFYLLNSEFHFRFSYFLQWTEIAVLTAFFSSGCNKTENQPKKRYKLLHITR